MRLDVEMIDTDPVPPCLSGSPPRGGRPEREPVVRFLNDRLDPRGQPAICGLLTSGQHGPGARPGRSGAARGGPAAGGSNGPAHRRNGHGAGARELDRTGDEDRRRRPVGGLPAAGREVRRGGLGQEPGLVDAGGSRMVERAGEQGAAEPMAAPAAVTASERTSASLPNSSSATQPARQPSSARATRTSPARVAFGEPVTRQRRRLQESLDLGQLIRGRDVNSGNGAVIRSSIRGPQLDLPSFAPAPRRTCRQGAARALRGGLSPRRRHLPAPLATRPAAGWRRRSPRTDRRRPRASGSGGFRQPGCGEAGRVLAERERAGDAAREAPALGPSVGVRSSSATMSLTRGARPGAAPRDLGEDARLLGGEVDDAVA